ncbi:MAG TPA: glutamate formimidoyltransferase [Bryobacteraceae bacterium]|nr:glutamate formimidoyltransferase [Bryobacteraceae bacterium]
MKCMGETLVECVPNFSEGRDPSRIGAIAEAIRSAGAIVLDRTSDPDHNRSVITFAAPVGVVEEAAFRAVRQAVGSLDLRAHTGVHPRIGVADVVPFVPLTDIRLDECAHLATAAGRRIWQELRVPVYLYEAAAVRPECRNLADVRRNAPACPPDFGGPELHPSAGAVVIGARKFLIAFNVNLATSDVGIARRIARTVRASSGGLPAVKAIGLLLASRNLAQVSMNLTDFEQTGVREAFEAVRAEAARYGIAIAGSELIGLIPQKALDLADVPALRMENFDPSMILENRLRERR